MGAETHDVDLGHSGRENSEKTGGRQEGRGQRIGPLLFTAIFHPGQL